MCGFSAMAGPADTPGDHIKRAQGVAFHSEKKKASKDLKGSSKGLF